MGDLGGQGQSPFFGQTLHYEKNTHTGQIKYQEFEQKNVTFHQPFFSKTIEQRLSNHSSNETIFNQSKIPFKKALNESGYQETLSYNPTTMENRPKNRKRNITWFNPPYNKNVITKIGHKFLHLISKHFPKQHKFNKIFNRNTVKVRTARKTSKASYRATTKT